jgi:lysyl-tRNA synthetase, class I
MPADMAAHLRASSTAARPLPSTPRPLPYRTLASVVDVTAGNDQQTLRILSELDPERPVRTLDEVRPRLDCAQRWITTQVAEEQRTRVRDEPDTALLESLDGEQRESLRLLLDGLEDHWSLEGLTQLVYGVPKTQAGIAPDAKPTPELKVAQRSFFALLYRLLVGRDTGPRLPTLLLAVGTDRVRKLLGS